MGRRCGDMGRTTRYVLFFLRDYSIFIIIDESGWISSTRYFTYLDWDTKNAISTKVSIPTVFSVHLRTYIHIESLHREDDSIYILLTSKQKYIVASSKFIKHSCIIEICQRISYPSKREKFSSNDDGNNNINSSNECLKHVNDE